MSIGLILMAIVVVVGTSERANVCKAADCERVDRRLEKGSQSAL